MLYCSDVNVAVFAVAAVATVAAVAAVLLWFVVFKQTGRCVGQGWALGAGHCSLLGIDSRLVLMLIFPT